MILDTDEGQQKQLYWTGSYDPRAVEALVHHLPDNGVLIDVGAGIGGICLFVLNNCLRAGKCVSGHAFEPLGLNYDRLLRNMTMNSLAGHLTCHRMALGAKKGSLNLCFRGGAGSAAVMQSGTEISALAGSRLECVPAETLDGWVIENKLERLDVVKVDIEGAEPLMLRGAMATIEHFRPVILGEFNNWWAERHGLSIAAECFEPLWNMGYEAFRLDSRHGPWKKVTGRPAPGPDMQDTLWIHPERPTFA